MELTKSAHLTRQLDLIPLESLGIPVTIIGCGAIGSFTALALAKMGVTNIEVWDHDEVSIENMSSQFFRFKDIGSNKAAALAMLIHDFTGVVIKHNPKKYMDLDVLSTSGILITAVDSMKARAMVYNALISTANAVKLVIDPRMGAEVYAQYTYRKIDSWYENCLYSDAEAVQERCTAKSTVYTAALAAGLITKTVKNYITNQPYPKTINWNISSSSKGTMNMSPSKEDKNETTKH